MDGGGGLPLLLGVITTAFGALPELAVAQALSATLTPATHHGYHISCFGGSDGAIDLSVSGGTPPYTYAWSTGATTQDVSGLRSGFITVTVGDAGTGSARPAITLTEPAALTATLVPYLYGSGYNVSCNSCYNGSIQVTASGGVAAYTYSWTDGPTTEDRSSLDAGSYKLRVTDANGCQFNSETCVLTQPERDDWTKSGNAGTMPGTHFIGSTDNKDVVFKSNGVERLRIGSNGDLRASSLTFTNGYRPVFVDSAGVLKIGIGTGQMFPGRPNDECCPTQTPWFLCGNNICVDQRLGTNNNMPLEVITNGVRRMHISTSGRVGIGIGVTNEAVENYRLFVEGGVICRDVKVTAGNFPDYVFQKNYRLMPLDEVARYIDDHGHLPNIPSAAEVEANGGFEVGDLQQCLLRTLEEQQLYILQLSEQLKEVRAHLVALEKH